MAELRPRAVQFCPGGIGLSEALDQTVQPGTVVSALDDQTLWTVRRLVNQDPDEVIYKAFGDLIAWVSRMLGLPTARRTSPSQLRAMVMRAAADLPQDSILATARLFPGTADAVGKAMTLLHYYGHTLDDLKHASEQVDGPLAQKLLDLVQLEENVRLQMAATNQEFGADRALHCLQTTAPEELPIKHLVVVAGHERSPLYEQWLLWLAAQGVSIDVLIEQNGQEDKGFVPQRKTLNHLKPTVQKTAKSKQPTTGWTHALFQNTEAKNPPQTAILETPDPLAECESILRKCFEANIEKGVPFDQIGIFIRDQELYAPLLLASSKRLGVPVAMRMSLPLLGNGFAALVLKLLQPLSGKDVRNLGYLVSSSYFGLPSTTAKTVQSLCRDAYATSTPWETLAELLKEEEGVQSVLGALDWRTKYKEKDGTVREWKDALIDLCNHTPLLDHMLESPLTSERDTRAQTLLQRSLQDLALECADQTFTLPEFVKRAEQLWSLENVVWPTIDDRYLSDTASAVKVCTTTHQLADFDHVYVLGMLEGTIPRRRSEDPVLSDHEREQLNEAFPQKEPLPTSHQEAAAERNEFIRICGSAKSVLHFSFPETSGDKDNIPAFYLEEIKRAVPSTEKEIQLRSQIVPTQQDCKLAADFWLRQSMDAPKEPFVFPSLHNEAALQKVQQKEDPVYKPEDISTVLSCPFRAYFRRQRIYQNSYKTFLNVFQNVPGQVVLAQFDDAEEGRKNLAHQMDQVVERERPRLQPWAQRLIRRGSDRLINQWVEREWKARETFGIFNARVTPEFPLGGDPTGFEWKINGVPVRFYGTIPALAEQGETGIAILYDSSPPDIRPESAFTERLGDTVEIGLTMLGLMKTHQEVCVQIEGLESRRIYFLAKPSNVRRGVCKDPKIDTNYLAFGDDRSDGQKKREFYEELRTHVAEAVQKLQSGDISPTPGDPCETCRYADLCRSHLQDGEQNVNSDNPEVVE